MDSEVAVRGAALKRHRSWIDVVSEKWNRDLNRLIRQTRILILLTRHPAVPWHAKLIGVGTLGYLLSPIQLIPTFVPVIGQLDDLAVLFIGTKLLRLLTPKYVMSDCEARLGRSENESREEEPSCSKRSTNSVIPHSSNRIVFTVFFLGLFFVGLSSIHAKARSGATSPGASTEELQKALRILWRASSASHSKIARTSSAVRLLETTRSTFSARSLKATACDLLFRQRRWISIDRPGGAGGRRVCLSWRRVNGYELKNQTRGNTEEKDNAR